MEKKWKKLAAGILLVGWMTVIFCFSAQPAEESSQLSGSVAYQVVDTTDKMFGMEWSMQQIFFYTQKLDFPIRKAAHMTEYAILALLSFLFYGTMGKQGKMCYLLSVVTAAVYASTDEIHQLFVPGRSGQVRDVCIDTTGAVIGLLLLCFIRKKYRNHCEKKQHLLQ